MRTKCLAAIFILTTMAAVGYAEDRANFYVGFPIVFAGSQLFGVNGAIDVNANKWFGVRSDVGIHVGEVYADKSLVTFLAGPVFSAPFNRVTPFAHLLFGGAHSGCGAFNMGCRSSVVFTTAVGAGLNLKMSNSLGVRVLADDLRTRFGGKIQHFPRVSAGIVFAF
jgi:hypothetical protein